MSPRPAASLSSDRRRGVVLLAVLVVVVLLTLGAYQFNELMLAEYKAASSSTRSAQAHALAESGIFYAAAALATPDTLLGVLSNNPYDNPEAFEGILVHPSEQPRFRGRVSILTPVDPEDLASGGRSYRFGVVDEGGKINVNALFKLDSSGKIAHDVLMLLPNMTEDIVNAILDWLDPDEESRPNGAESEVYSQNSPPYRPKNGPLDSLEELLLVRGVTVPLLFGNDHNRNGILDANEQDGSGLLDRGWAQYLTIYSRERNVDAQGNPRIYVNDADLQSLQTKLNEAVGQELATYIIAYRMYGPASTSTSTSGATGRAAQAPQAPQKPTREGPTSRTDRATASSQIQQSLGRGGQGQGGTRISSLYELINSSVSISSGSSGTTTSVAASPAGDVIAVQVTQTTQTTMTLPSPLRDSAQLRQLLPLMLDKLTTQKDIEIPARINVNTAPRAVLSTLPGLTEADVQTILERRPTPEELEAADTIFDTPTWLITEANLPADTLRTLERYITCRTQVYRVQALGHFDGGGPTARIEAVIDTNNGRPRILYWRDLTELGKGFNLQMSQ